MHQITLNTRFATATLTVKDGTTFRNVKEVAEHLFSIPVSRQYVLSQDFWGDRMEDHARVQDCCYKVFYIFRSNGVIGNIALAAVGAANLATGGVAFALGALSLHYLVGRGFDLAMIHAGLPDFVVELNELREIAGV